MHGRCSVAGEYIVSYIGKVKVKSIGKKGKVKIF